MYETIRNIMQFITSVNTVTFRTNTVMYKSDTVVIDWQYRRRKSRNVHKRATTDVNDQIYVCRTNLIQTLLQQLNMHARAANYTRFTQITTHNQMYIIPHNAAKSCSPRARPLTTQVGHQSSPGFRYPPMLSTTNNDALHCLLAWPLTCCWRQTATQPITTSQVQIIRI